MQKRSGATSIKFTIDVEHVFHSCAEAIYVGVYRVRVSCIDDHVRFASTHARFRVTRGAWSDTATTRAPSTLLSRSGIATDIYYYVILKRVRTCVRTVRICSGSPCYTEPDWSEVTSHGTSIDIIYRLRKRLRSL